ncbi:MAG: SHOCT domain-containing protein [bacterium]|nr:SHOCT domain-containing protein [bacterium]
MAERVGLEDLVLWGVVLVGSIVVLCFAVALYRRRYRTSQDALAPPGWTLEDLRELHARGDLSDEEHAQLRSRTIREMGGGADKG